MLWCGVSRHVVVWYDVVCRIMLRWITVCVVVLRGYVMWCGVNNTK